MPSCVVKVCKNHSGMKRNDQAITFHRFPTSNKVWRKQLIDVIQISRGDKNWKPSKYSVICSIHFDASNLYFTKEGLAKLVDLALPTKFLFAPLSVTYVQNLEPAAPNTTLLQPATVQANCPPAPESLPKKPKAICPPAPESLPKKPKLPCASGQDPLSKVSEEPRASTLELLSQIPPGAVIIARVYKYLQKEYEELKARSGDAPALSFLGDILGRTASATGVNQRAVSAVLEADALKPYQGKREAKPEVGECKRPKYNSENKGVSPIKEESDDDDGDSATQEEPCEQENGEDDGLIETLKLEFYEDDDYDEYAHTKAGEQISRLQEIGSSEVSSAIQNLIASTVSRTQEGEVTKPATSTTSSTPSADPINYTPHAVKEEISDDEYRTLEPQMFARTYSRHGTPGKPRVQVKVEPIDEHSHPEPIDNATDDT